MGSLWALLQRFAELFIWWTTVLPWENAVRVRLGRKMSILGPGVHVRVPYIDKVFRQTIRLRIMDMPVQTVSTADGKTVTFVAAVGYKILDIALLYNTLHHAEGTIKNLVMACIARVIHGLNSADCTPKAVEEAVNRSFSLLGYGIQCTGVSLINFAFVRTYRLIQDNHWNTGDDNLNTIRPDSPQNGQPS